MAFADDTAIQKWRLHLVSGSACDESRSPIFRLVPFNADFHWPSRMYTMFAIQRCVAPETKPRPNPTIIVGAAIGALHSCYV